MQPRCLSEKLNRFTCCFLTKDECAFLTCADTVAERTALMESAYPQLYLYCKQRGYDFKMIDLRRGVEDPLTDHHDSAELHLGTLKECQETEGPNFFVSLSEFLVTYSVNDCKNSIR